MPTDVNPERAINDSYTGRESFWGSTGVAKQVQLELPLANVSNSWIFETKFPSPQEGDILTDANIFCYKDKILQELSKNCSKRNVEIHFSREKFVPEVASIDATQRLYRPLPSGHIRILELLPGHYGDDIQCRLHDAALEQNKFAYDALSYTWELNDSTLWRETVGVGENSDATKDPGVLFACKGLRVPVQRNLQDALRRMRDVQCSRYLWVDALCINQEDTTERAQQVQLMDLVYSYAYQVLIWLGESSWAFEVLDGVSRLVHLWAKEHDLDSIMPKFQYLKDGNDDQDTPQYTDGDLHMTSLLSLYDCRWFHRLWVLQEVALARSATVFYGRHNISWECVGIAASILRTNYALINRPLPSKKKKEVPTGLLNAYFMYRISTSQRLLKPLCFSFHQLLRLTRQFKCKQNRDKIFGLLAIPTTDNIARKIVPDYKKSDAEIYRVVAWTLIEGSSSLDILSSVQHDTERHGSEMTDSFHSMTEADLSRTQPNGPRSYNPELSSWVPQWHFVHTQALGLLEPDSSFAASRGIGARISSSTNLHTLKVAGNTVDRVATIKKCGPDDFEMHRLHPYGAASGEIVPQIDEDLDFIDQYQLVTEENVRKLPIRPTTKEDLQDIAITLTSGKTWQGLPVHDPESHLAGFAKCLVEGLIRWTLNDDVFGGVSEPHKDKPLVSVDDLVALSSTEDDMIRFRNAAIAACREHTCFNTASGLRGLGPAVMWPGDSVCVLYGASMPFIIRPEGAAYRLIGECYVYGLMRGQGVPEASADRENSWIELV